MHRTREKQLAGRAVELGNSGDGAALSELTGLLGADSVEVRRLAASAIGKLAGFSDAADSVSALPPLLNDPHPQVRQYAVKALKAYGADAAGILHDLRDMAADESEKDYNRRDANVAIEVIEQALRIREKQAVHHCRHCGIEISEDEYARSQRAFQRSFCDRCFDETYLKRRNFDTRVELNKTIRADDGTLVQSRGERRIADWLRQRGIAYRYDERVRIIEGYAVRPDFYLPEFDLYIEYWGMDTTDYKIAMLKKKKLYQQEGKRLVSVEREDRDRIESVLAERLSRYIRLPEANSPSAAQLDGELSPDSSDDLTLPEVGEEAETTCMFEVLDRYRDCLRLLLFRDTGRPPPENPLTDSERLQRTQTYCLRLRRTLAAAGHGPEDGKAPPTLSNLLRRLADRVPAARGKNRRRHEPPLLLWKLTHQPSPYTMRMSEAAACFLWYLRVTGRLDPEDKHAPSSDTVTAIVLLTVASPEGSHRRMTEIAIRMLTPLDAPRHHTHKEMNIR